ncbi:MAG: phosphocarrier protein HPr [Halieaceae bacterium]|jgi:phosphocarrier protein HPr
MLKSKLSIINKLGLHARAASKFVSCSNRFASSIRVARDDAWVDGKSIMSVMMLAAGQGTVLDVEIDGKDQDEALAALRALVDDYFGEGE